MLPSLSARSSRWGWMACWLLLLALAAVRPLALPDEGRYAEISRWMLVSGDWRVPRLNGLPFFHKPPLLHWLQAGFMGVLGVTPWAARLVPALAAGGMLAGLYLATRRLAGERLARTAAWILATSPAFLLAGQYINHDMLVAAWIATALWCFALAFMHPAAVTPDGQPARPHAGWARAGFAACALGLLTKGLIGVVLPGAVLFVWLSVTRRWRQVPNLPWVSGLALLTAIAAPWFLLAARDHPGLWNYMFGLQQFGRYTGSGFNNAQPWWFYVVVGSALLAPWPLLLLYRPRAAATADDRRLGDLLWLCWAWVGTVLLFFSLPRSKLVGYILPVMPALAVLCAAAWSRLTARRPAWAPWFSALVALPLVVSVAATFGVARFGSDRLNGEAAAALACLAAPQDPVYLLPPGAYPYDLPFVAQTQRPFIEVQNWPIQRQIAGDSWRRELMDAGDFAPEIAAQVLQTPDALPRAASEPRRWLLTGPRSAPETHAATYARMGWRPVYDDRRWTLWRSAPESPETAEQERLPGCHQQPGDQRRP